MYDIPVGKQDKEKPIEKHVFVMRVSLNQHNIPLLDDAEYIQEYKEGGLLSKKLMKINQKLKFKCSNYALLPKDRQAFFETENKLTSEDSHILEMKMVKNNLEAYAYEMRSNIDAYGSLEKYIDPKIKDSFMAELNQCVEWLYGEGENANPEDYLKRLNRFKEVGEQIKKRQFYWSELNVYFSQM
jgi:hypothetical protein